MKIKQFQVEMNHCLLKGDIFGDTADGSLLMLHGGGTASRNRFTLLRNDLWHQGVFSSAFDFIGCGDSEGNRNLTSLESQTKQAVCVIETLNMKPPISVMGASMGAYSAVKLLANFPIANLILIVPAMYAFTACKMPFNQGFTQIIRKPESWVDSDAWNLLRKFTGNLLIIAAEKDDVIPGDVIKRLIKAAVNVHSMTTIMVPGAPHKILDYLYNDSTVDTSEIINAITALMGKKNADLV